MLDIRVAVPKGQRSDYLMHAKTGAAVGAGTGPIVWVGSANDTWAGWSANYEQVLSLRGPAYGALATQVFTEFSRMWKGGSEGFRVLPATEMARSGKTQSRRKRGSARWTQHGAKYDDSLI